MSQEESDFLTDYKLSPSQLLKEKIWEMRGMIRNLVHNKMDGLQNFITEQADDLQRQGSEIDSLKELLIKHNVLEKEEA